MARPACSKTLRASSVQARVAAGSRAPVCTKKSVATNMRYGWLRTQTWRSKFVVWVAACTRMRTEFMVWVVGGSRAPVRTQTYGAISADPSEEDKYNHPHDVGAHLRGEMAMHSYMLAQPRNSFLQQHPPHQRQPSH
eukprot:1154692-Pelagomonas_calceolata.AAC.1